MTAFDRTAVPGHPGWICPNCGDTIVCCYRCTGLCETDLAGVPLTKATGQRGVA